MARRHKAGRPSKMRASKTADQQPAIDRNLQMENCARKSRLFDRESLLAFAIYFGLSLFFFGRGLIGHFGDRYIGVGDPPAQMYFLAWWPYAIAHFFNPFLDKLSWAPATVSMATNTSMVLAALIFSPITVLGGPVRAYNTLMLISPPISAWAAFILFRRICKRPWPALAGAYLFGFSPFMLAHLFGQPVLIAGWFPAFAVYLVLIRLDEEIGARKFALLFALVLSGQAGWSLEIFATMTLFGSITIVLAYWLADIALRRRIIGLAPPLACAYAMLAVIAAPYLYYFFHASPLEMPILGPATNSTDPINLLTPTRINAVGAWLSVKFVQRSNLFETTAYIGVPTLLTVGIVAVQRWGEIAVRLCVLMLAIIVVLAVGPFLAIDQHVISPAPELIVYAVFPLLRNAFPCRFDAFVFLCVGALVAMFLSDRSWRLSARIALGGLIIISLAPNLDSSFWFTPAKVPMFFRNGIYKKYISRNEVVLLLPYGDTGVSDLWQVESGFYFRTAGAYLGLTPPVPHSYRDWPIVQALYGLFPPPDVTEQLCAFLLDKRITKVIVPDSGSPVVQWVYDEEPASFVMRPFTSDEREVIKDFFAPLDSEPLHVAGVTIYRVPLDRLDKYAKYTPAELQNAAARRRLQTLVNAANAYLAQGRSADKLNLFEASRLGLIPKLWLAGPLYSGYPPDLGKKNGLILQGAKDGAITVGLWGSWPALEALRHEYAPYCRTSRLRKSWLTVNVAEWHLFVLSFDFDREGLARAAAFASERNAEDGALAQGRPGPSLKN